VCVRMEKERGTERQMQLLQRRKGPQVAVAKARAGSAQMMESSEDPSREHARSVHMLPQLQQDSVQ
jgi:hypothetical protein